MQNQIAVESDGLGPLAGVVGGGIRGVNDKSACLVENFKPTVYELEVLARHYLEKIRDIEFWERFYRTTGSYQIRMRPFASRRLATIESALGEQRFQNAIASTEEEWNKVFAEAEEIESNLEPCKRCGAQRNYYDYADPHIPDGYCSTCDPASGQADDRCDVKGLQATLTEEEMAAARQWVEQNQRRTETHISRMTGGPDD